MAWNMRVGQLLDIQIKLIFVRSNTSLHTLPDIVFQASQIKRVIALLTTIVYLNFRIWPEILFPIFQYKIKLLQTRKY
jgi:hypothetical protein